MISQEDLAKKIKLATQNAWRVETNTTVNTVCEYIVKEAVTELLASLEAEFALVYKHQDSLQASVDYITGELNASTDGGVSQPQRSTETENKRGRGNAKAGPSNGANGA
jgi:hypothetical protein